MRCSSGVFLAIPRRAAKRNIHCKQDGLSKKQVTARARKSKKAATKTNVKKIPLAADGVVTHRAFALLSLTTLVAMSLIFAPISLWPLSFVCLVPWLVYVGSAGQAPRVYFHSLLLGLAFFLINMRWMYPATGWGYLAISIYQAFYLPVVAIPVRSVVRRRHWPLAIVFPFVWVGGEMLRAVLISGFPWFFLAHSAYKFLPIIQVSDFVGAYGVSFIIAAMNGAIADLVIRRLSSGRSGAAGISLRSARVGIAVALILLFGSLGYGWFRLHQDTIAEGPKVAVLQGDFLNSVHGKQVSPVEKRDFYLDMIDGAAGEKPDLFLLPETPWTMFLNPEIRDFYRLCRDSFEELQHRSTKYNAHLVIGSISKIRTPYDLLTKERLYNSAMVFNPDGRELARYDKIHLVYFGEIVPFRFGRLRPLYFWLNSIMPFSGSDGSREYSLFPGEEFRTFSMTPASMPDSTFQFGTPICYEDVMPYVAREFVSGGHNKKQADFLLNISNDGWFGRGVQQPQHLAICVFRAVENRVGIARSVNTGVSGFIDPTGHRYGLVPGESATMAGDNAGYSVAHVKTDSRYTIYSQYGDWFGWLCVIVWFAFFVDYWIVRVQTRNKETASGVSA